MSRHNCDVVEFFLWLRTKGSISSFSFRPSRTKRDCVYLICCETVKCVFVFSQAPSALTIRRSRATLLTSNERHLSRREETGSGCITPCRHRQIQKHGKFLTRP